MNSSVSHVGTITIAPDKDSEQIYKRKKLQLPATLKINYIKDAKYRICACPSDSHSIDDCPLGGLPQSFVAHKTLWLSSLLHSSSTSANSRKAVLPRIKQSKFRLTDTSRKVKSKSEDATKLERASEKQSEKKSKSSEVQESSEESEGETSHSRLKRHQKSEKKGRKHDSKSTLSTEEVTKLVAAITTEALSKLTRLKD
nr:non-structural protein [Homalodisca vitripennis reovirus]ADN64696.1 non-structural protein [Homalodisca vitripennis reovirus]ADN64698.1 non-structural protein [Homalodisca vitripennis reovirus]ADN64700.1 non-structural protein [Homalodisca vitripennis reovirus]ADN64720.1 non-structural protein [Homalodisca vitripennis reovirus]